jgi:hypothetical protein
MDTPGEIATQQKFHRVEEDWLAKAERLHSQWGSS